MFAIDDLMRRKLLPQDHGQVAQRVLLRCDKGARSVWRPRRRDRYG